MDTVQTLTFPALGWEFQLDRVAFRMGGLAFYWYGILIAIGFTLAIFYVFRRAKEFGLNEDRMVDVIFGASIAGIVGARLYYVAFRWDYYSSNLNEIFNTRSGGLAIYGGILFGFAAGYLLCRWRKVKFLPMADAVTGGFLIGQAIGRWGNFVNIEAFGANTSLPWGMSGPVIIQYLSNHEAELEAMGMNIDPSMPVHPTFFYESMWCLLGFLFIALYTKHRRFDGELALFYAGWYGLGRMFIEGMRTDSLVIGNTGIRVSQVLAGVLTVGALCVWLLVRSKIKKGGSDCLPLYVTTEESHQAVSGELYKKQKREEPAETIEPAEPAADTGPAAPTANAEATVPAENGADGQTEKAAEAAGANQDAAPENPIAEQKNEEEGKPRQ